VIEASLLLLIGILVIGANIAATAYFVAQEFAYMSVDRTRLAVRAQEGDPSAQRALTVTKRTSFMLSGAQLGITITGLLVGFLSEPLLGEPLGVLLSGLGIPPEIGVTIGTLSDWLRRKATKSEVKALTVAKVTPIYRKNHWDKVRGDHLPGASTWPASASR